MNEEISIDNKVEQYQMNGAALGLIAGLVVGVVIFGGVGGALAGGVGGLFVGAVLGTIVGKVNRTTGRVLIGMIVLVIVVVLARNILQAINTARTTSQPYYDNIYYEGEQMR
jgi:F0F1-type ATP synthase assembly protein I